MDFQSWITNIEGLSGIYSFDILPDGSFSEIRLMGVNKQNEGIVTRRPDAPEFYPGIPYREYWCDINFENFVYKCGSTNQPLYSYVNAHGYWLKGFYIPITEPGTVSAYVNAQVEPGKKRTVNCLYILTYSPVVESDSMSQHDSDISSAVMNITIKLHETPDFHKAMSATMAEIKKICQAENCSLYTVDVSNQHCNFINDNGVQSEYLKSFASEMGRTPFEVAMAWEKDLADSDCLLLDDLSVVEERDPVWYRSLCSNNIRNIILYAVRFNQTLVGFIWAANFDVSKMMKIKEILELTTFLIAAVIANHQLISRLEIMSTIDGLTQVFSRNAMNERVDKLVSGEAALPDTMGIVFADLNGLKTVNDVEGHDAGDRLLSRASSILKIAFGDHEIYRAGGDEFVVLCPGITGEKLEQNVKQLRSIMESTPDVSFATGTEYVTGKYDICKAMRAADERMYKDKEDYYRNHPDKDRRKRSR
ncbi:MAG: GGDEF domain-containing protein [Ruminiclostridium sp.]|nr:GGDEF domain-containing protein [Ruminiclostridium sp.]